jgi:hypothetical protein
MGGRYWEAGGVRHHHLLEMEVVVPLEEATSMIIPNGEEVEEAGEVTVVVVVVVVGMIVGGLKEVAMEIRSGGGHRTEVNNDKWIDNSRPVSIQGRPKRQTVQ